MRGAGAEWRRWLVWVHQRGERFRKGTRIPSNAGQGFREEREGSVLGGISGVERNLKWDVL